MSNPRFEIIPTSPAPTRIALVLAQSEKPTLLGIGFYVSSPLLISVVVVVVVVVVGIGFYVSSLPRSCLSVGVLVVVVCCL